MNTTSEIPSVLSLREQDGSLISPLAPPLAINGGNQLELGQEDTYNYTDNFWYHLEWSPNDVKASSNSE